MQQIRTRMPVAAAAVAAVVALAAGCGEGDPPSLPPPAPTPLDVPAAAGRWRDLTWTHRDIEPERGGNVRLVSVAATAERIVAVGVDEGARLDTFFVSSVDGADWEDELGLVGVELVDVAAGADGFFAAGANEPNADGVPRGAMFASIDGRAWEPAGDFVPLFDAHMLSVAAGPGGYIATGASAKGEPLIWLSGDGETWRRTTTQELGLPRTSIESIGAGPNGWLAVGGPRSGSLVMSSTDGAGWTGSELAAGRPDHRAIAMDAVDGGRARLIVGTEAQDCGFLWWEGDCGGYPAAWWSDAAGPWVPLPVAGTPLGEWPVIASSGDGFVAASALGVHGSGDGQAWSTLTRLDPEAGLLPADILVTDDRIVIVGHRTLPDGRMLGWIAVGAP